MNCDYIAPLYRALEYAAFGGALERSRFLYLNRLVNARRILVLGEGDGRCLERLLRAAPQAEIDVLDSSRAMLSLARERCGAAGRGRVQFHHQDAARSKAWPRGDYDAVVTHFFLDCFTAVEASVVILRIAAALQEGGIWLVSDFAIPPAGWRRWHAAAWIRIMYWFFGFATGLRVRTLPPYETLLAGAGLVRQTRSEARLGMLVSAVWHKPGNAGDPAYSADGS